MSNPCTIEIRQNGCVSLSGPLVLDSVPSVYRQAESFFSSAPASVQVDLCKITTVDSAGLALLLEWQALQRGADRNMKVLNAPDGLISLAQLCEADDVMTISGRAHTP